MRKILLLLLSLILSVSMLSACALDDGFSPNEYILEQSEVHGISIDVVDREVDVSLSDDDMLHISYYESAKEGYEIENREGVVVMSTSNDKDFSDYFGFKPSEDLRKISLRLPEKVFSSIAIETTNEDILIDSMPETGSISLSSNGGDIEFDRIDASSSITLNVKNGNINGSIIGGYDDFTISTNVKKGECNLPNKDGGVKKLDISANNGDVTVDLIAE